MHHESSKNQTVDFVLVTALPEERDAVLSKLPGYRKLPPSTDDFRNYFQAELSVTFSDNSSGIYRVIIFSLLDMGRVQAATATADAIRRWHPRYVLLIGIAGGIASSGVRLGDILISNQIVDYELQKLTPQGPEVRWEVHRPDGRLLDACKNIMDASWQNLILVKRPNRGKPQQHIGPIASGDKVIAFGEVLKNYQNIWPKLIGVEMEAGGVATAVSQTDTSPGFFMVRSVSDLADENKGSADIKKWRAYACDVAASYAIAFLQSGPIPLSDGSFREKVKRIELILEGEFNELTSGRQQDIVRVLAILLSIDPSDIRVLTVSEGSIVIIIEVPDNAADHFYEMASSQDSSMILRVKSILVDGRDGIRIPRTEQQMAMEILSLLRFMDESIIQQLLISVKGDIYINWKPDDYRQILKAWDARGFLIWYGGYALKPEIRSVSRTYFNNDPDIIRRIHEAAIQIYQMRLKTPIDDRKRYIVEELFHHASLANLTRSDHHNLLQILDRRLDEYPEYLKSYAEGWRSTLKNVKTAIDRDDEIRELVDESVISKLIERIDARIGSIGGETMSNVNMYESAVFVSYAWGGESENIVDELEKSFAEHGIHIVRDKKDLDYKGSLGEFEQRIGQGQCIVLVISDKYLCSEHCMYELIKIDENQRFRERIFPVVLEDAHIYKAADRLKYIQYWDRKIDELNEAIKQVNVLSSLEDIMADLNKYTQIRDKFDRLTGMLRDMNTLTPKIHAASGFSFLINAVKREFERLSASQPSITVMPQPKAEVPDSTPEPLLLKLSGGQVEKFTKALLSAFPSVDYLERMVHFKLDKNIHEIADGDLETCVYKLLQWAKANGKLKELLIGARQANPGNPDLEKFAREMGYP